MTVLTAVPATPLPHLCPAERPHEPQTHEPQTHEPQTHERHLFAVRPAPVSAPPYDDEPGPRPFLRLVTTPLPAPELTLEPALLPEGRTATADLPSARPFVTGVVRGLLDVLVGVRGIKQLSGSLTPELYADLLPRLTARTDAPGPRPDSRAVRSVHLQTRPEGVVEASATVQRGGRLRALALRLEGFEGRWVVTDVVGL